MQCPEIKLLGVMRDESTHTNVPAKIILVTHTGNPEEFHRCVSYLSYIKQFQKEIEGRHLKALGTQMQTSI